MQVNSTARLSAELWAQIKNEDWSLVSSYYTSDLGWPRRLWNFDKPYQWSATRGRRNRLRRARVGWRRREQSTPLSVASKPTAT
jgi:hypothetical protein